MGASSGSIGVHLVGDRGCANLRFVRGPRGSVLLVIAALAAACGDASTSKIGPKGGSAGVSDDDDTRSEKPNDGVLDETGGSTSGDPGTTTTAGDDDGDGVPNADDCDPASKTLRRRIVEDALGSDKGLFAPAAGFPTASWTFDGAAAYRQVRLADAADVSFYAKEADLGDVQIEVTAASAEVSSAIAPRLRQIFVVVGGASANNTFSAVGCGIEVVQGETPEQRTTVVKLAGTSGAVTSTVLQRVSRPAVQVDEDFALKLRFLDGAMICDVTQPGAPGGAVTTTATANNLGALTGSVGLFTRQTKATFKNVRVCALK
jgi:hypothetical protein